jgi:hypothetical protein
MESISKISVSDHQLPNFVAAVINACLSVYFVYFYFVSELSAVFTFSARESFFIFAAISFEAGNVC